MGKLVSQVGPEINLMESIDGQPVPSPTIWMQALLAGQLAVKLLVC